MTDNQYTKYITANGLYDFENKFNSIWDHIAYRLNMLIPRIHYKGIEEVPGLQEHERELSLLLLTKGFAGINTQPIDGKFYAFSGGLGGEPDAYYMPTIFTVANPYLNISKEWKIDEDVVIIRNDSTYSGVLPMLTRYATLLAETELSMRNALYDTRSQMAMVAANDKIKEAVEKYFDDRIKGKVDAILGNQFLAQDGDDVRSLPLQSSAATKPLSELIEFSQYIKASEYNEMGLNANYNMKREALNSAESALNDDILFPAMDDAINRQKEDFAKWNKLTGYNIVPELGSAWADNEEEQEAEMEAINPEEQLEETEEQKEEKEEQPEEEEKKDE